MTTPHKTELEELIESHSRGKWGFSVGYIPSAGQGSVNNPAQSLLTVDTPAWMARPWTVTLGHMTFAGGPLVGASPPPDNQTPNFVQVLLDWGVDSGRERAVIDWPWSGSTFQFHAASFRLYQQPAQGNLNNVRPPILNGWASPFACGARATDFLGPTFTDYTSVFALAALGGTVDVPVPARAVAYRFVQNMTLAAAQAAPFVQLEQYAGGQLIRESQDGDYSLNTFTPPRQAIIPLLSLASIIRVTNPNTPGTLTGSVQFLLDLG